FHDQLRRTQRQSVAANEDGCWLVTRDEIAGTLYKVRYGVVSSIIRTTARGNFQLLRTASVAHELLQLQTLEEILHATDKQAGQVLLETLPGIGSLLQVGGTLLGTQAAVDRLLQ